MPSPMIKMKLKKNLLQVVQIANGSSRSVGQNPKSALFTSAPHLQEQVSSTELCKGHGLKKYAKHQTEHLKEIRLSVTFLSPSDFLQQIYQPWKKFVA